MFLILFGSGARLTNASINVENFTRSSLAEFLVLVEDYYWKLYTMKDMTYDEYFNIVNGED